MKLLKNIAHQINTVVEWWWLSDDVVSMCGINTQLGDVLATRLRMMPEQSRRFFNILTPVVLQYITGTHIYHRGNAWQALPLWYICVPVILGKYVYIYLILLSYTRLCYMFKMFNISTCFLSNHAPNSKFYFWYMNAYMVWPQVICQKDCL